MDIKLMQPVSFSYQSKFYLFDKITVTGIGEELQLTSTATQIKWHSVDTGRGQGMKDYFKGEVADRLFMELGFGEDKDVDRSKKNILEVASVIEVLADQAIDKDTKKITLINARNDGYIDEDDALELACQYL